MSTPAGDGFVGDATINVNANTDPATRALAQFSRDANGRLRNLRGQFVSESALITRSMTTAAGGGDRFGLSLRSLANVASSVGSVLGRVGVGVAGLGGAAGTAAPLLAGIVTTLQNVAPAGAVAVTGMLAVQQASAVIRLGMMGVQESVTAAFDTSAAGAAKFQASLQGLAPSARDFALTVRELAPAFREFQQTIQQELFNELDSVLKTVATATLPVLRTNLATTANILGNMAAQTGLAAAALAKDGTLGQAMDGANQGLRNLEGVPAQVTTALGQLAAAGAPAFDRITAAAAGAATGISERLGSAFESGALTNAVNTAVNVLRDLGTVGANVFAILGNVMAPVQAEGAGLVGVLVEITGALREATGTAGFQQAIGALAGVMGTLASTVGPLLGQALGAIGPIFTALGPPVERLITSLGTALSPIIAELGPVLAAAAGAVGILLDAFSPLLPVIGNLVASLLPPLVPVINAIAQAWAGAAPIVQQLGQILTAVLAPIIAQLPAILAPLIATFTNLTSQILPVVSQLLTALAPTLASLGASFGQLLAAVAPLLGVLGQLVGNVLASLLPILGPIIGLVARLASVFASQLASVINNVVAPALRLVTALLRGDFSGAWNALKALFTGIGRHIQTSVSNMGRVISSILGTIVSVVKKLPGRLFSALAALGGGLFRIASQAWARFRNAVATGASNVVGFVRGVPGRIRGALSSLAGFLAAVGRLALSRFLSAVRGGASSAIGFVRGIPGRIRGALGALGGLLYSAGRSIIQGLINGIRNMAGNVRSAVSSVLSDARDLLPFSPAKKGPFSGKGWTLYSGRSISEDLAKGITQRQSLVQRAMRSLTQSAQSSVSVAPTPAQGDQAAGRGSAGRRAGSAARPKTGYTAAVSELQKLVDSGRWRKSGSLLFEDIAFQGMSANFQKHQMKIADGFWEAVAEIKKAVRSGKAVFEDMTFKGMSGNVSRFHDAIAQIWKGNPYGRNFGDWGNFGAYGRYGKYAGGGPIKGPGTSTSDSFLIRASDDEFMMRAAAVRYYGQGTMAALNSMRIPRTAIPTPAVSSMRTAGRAPAAAGGDLHVHVHNDGVIGSQIEVDNWLAKSMDRLDRTNRLPKTLARR